MAGRQSVVLPAFLALVTTTFAYGSAIAYAEGSRCGSVVIATDDLNRAIHEFIGESDCTLIEMGANIQIERDDPLLEPIALVANGPLDALEPVNKSLTIDGKGFTLTGDSEVSGFVIYLGAPDGSNTLTIRNLGMSGFGGSGALVVVSGRTLIEHSLFTDNIRVTESPIPRTQFASAGAVNVFGRLTVLESQFERNIGSAGGAIYNSPTLAPLLDATGADTSTLRISGSTFANNEAAETGGAIFALQSLTMTNSTITHNSADSSGGLNVAGSVFLDFCTIVGNTSTVSRAAISATSSVTILHSIVFGNVAPGVVKDVSSDGILTITSTLLTSESSVDSTLAPATLDDSNIVEQDPQLKELRNYGGFSLPGGSTIRTHLPLHGSPVIDLIDLAMMSNTAETTDQRGTGFPRVVNGRADMGAVEYSPVVVPDPTTSPTNPLPDLEDFPWSLNLQQQTHLPDTT